MIALGQQSQIRRLGFELGAEWAGAFAIVAVTSGAIHNVLRPALVSILRRAGTRIVITMAAAAKPAKIGLPITFILECLGVKVRNWLQKFRSRSLIQIKRLALAMGLVASMDARERKNAIMTFHLAIQKLSPQDDFQRALQSRAAQLSNDLAQTRLLLSVESDSLIPAPFLAVLAFWLVIIFASFSLCSRLNVTVFTCLSLIALSAACAIFLILELSQPFTGVLMISSAPLRNALAPL